MAEHNTTGRIGEDIAKEYLKQRGYRFVESNFSKMWGEIDLVMKKRGVIHFVEVKSTSLPVDQHQYPDPIEHLNRRKLQRLARAVQSYAVERGVSLERGKWQCDACVVYLDGGRSRAEIKYIENILLGE